MARSQRIRRKFFADTKKQKRELTLLIWIRFISIFIIILGILFVFVVRPSRIDGNSMYPTFEDGDVGINNVLYAHIKKVKRFDIVEVYDDSKETSYFKRVIGLPGEVVQYRDDKLYINGEVKDEYFLDNSGLKKSLNIKNKDFTKNYGPIRLAEDEYFVCGDNRIASYDSRNYGPIKKDAINSVGFIRIFH